VGEVDLFAFLYKGTQEVDSAPYQSNKSLHPDKFRSGMHNSLIQSAFAQPVLNMPRTGHDQDATSITNMLLQYSFVSQILRKQVLGQWVEWVPSTHVYLRLTHQRGNTYTSLGKQPRTAYGIEQNSSRLRTRFCPCLKPFLITEESTWATKLKLKWFKLF
jgi:hypothetical protein